VNRVWFLQPARLEVLAEVAYYHRFENTTCVSQGFPLRTGISLGRTKITDIMAGYPGLAEKAICQAVGPGPAGGVAG
jgi:hypothetical protein